jgi:polyhydroxyalkanoate synthesis regulator phasin
MVTFGTIAAMGAHLSTDQIESACTDLFSTQARVTVNEVMARLKRLHGTGGRRARVAAILRQIESALPFRSPPPAEPSAIAELEQRLKAADERARRAEQRAALAEELERKHQDFWAARYDQKAQELERRYATLEQTSTRASSEQLLRLYQRIAALTRRLSQYEPADPMT